MMNLTINAARLMRELQHLATLTDCPQMSGDSLPAPTQAVTRIVFTQRDLEARDWLRQLSLDAGFSVREDAIGNMFLRWEGSDATLPAVGTGSHTDAIPFAGMYDGTVGVLGGIEAMRSLQEAGFVPKRAIETIVFTSEEPTRFGIGCIGSRLLAGVMDADTADKLLDRLTETQPDAPAGLTLAQVRTAAGFAGSLESVKLSPNYFDFWIELHIEQGPLLERDGIELGIVTAIAAPAGYRYTVEGLGGHAGALLMPDRRDALCAAAEIILAAERYVLAANTAAGCADTVATVGMMSVHPGAANSVPSRVTFTLDIRDIDVARREAVMASIRSGIEDIEQHRHVTVTEERINADPPAHSGERIVSVLEEICRAEDISHTKMVSRAYHDTSCMAVIAPVAMLFIPCRNGVSHRPDEYSSPESIEIGARVLALALAKLSSA